MPARATAARCASSSSAPSAGPASRRPRAARPCSASTTSQPLFDGSPHGPAAIAPGEPVAEAGIAPAWLLERFDPLVGPDELPALLERAPLDVRVNRLKAADARASRRRADAALADRPAPSRRHQVEQLTAWRLGQIEVQDEGSQLICLACEAAPGMLVVDLCAGAGGKTLALAAEMANEGRLVACDTDRGRLSRLPPRAGARRRHRSSRRACSIRAARRRRSPTSPARPTWSWSTRPARAPAPGGAIPRRAGGSRPSGSPASPRCRPACSTSAASLVRPGGRLVYAVCSLLAEEGRDQAEALAARSSLVPEPLAIAAGRAAGPGRLLSPAHDGTDGFFVARWRRPC